MTVSFCIAVVLLHCAVWAAPVVPLTDGKSVSVEVEALIQGPSTQGCQAITQASKPLEESGLAGSACHSSVTLGGSSASTYICYEAQSTAALSCRGYGSACYGKGNGCCPGYHYLGDITQGAVCLTWGLMDALPALSCTAQEADTEYSWSWYSGAQGWWSCPTTSCSDVNC